MSVFSDIEKALSSHDPEDRRQAAAQLGNQKSESVVPLLMHALGDEDWRVRKEATLVAIVHAPSPDVLRGLVDALKPGGENVGLRNASVEALAGYGSAAVDALHTALPVLDADGRKLAVEALGRTGIAGALLVLRPLLTDEDPNVRATAVESIAAIGASCFDAAVPLLEQSLDAPDNFVRLAALDGLNQLGVVLRWERLEHLIGDPIMERAILLAAGRSGNSKALPLLVGALESARGAAWQGALTAVADFVRAGEHSWAAACRALAELTGPARDHLLEEAAGVADDVETRRAALVLTGALGTKEAAAVAADALSDDRVAGVAEQALSLLGPVAVPALVARARSGTNDERTLCIELLGRLADVSDADFAIDAVREALSDESPEVVSSALGALAIIGDERCLAAAAAWLGPDINVGVRTAAAAALGAIARRHPGAARVLARTISADRAEAQVAALIMAALGSPVIGNSADDSDFLAQALSNDNALVRRAALDAFAALGFAEGVEAVAFALTDEEHDVQLAAVRALGNMRAADGSVAGLSHLLELIGRSEDEALVAAAIRALGEAGDSRALGVLKPLVRMGTAMQAVAAVEALGNIADPRRVNALTSALSHADSEVVKAALRVLAHENDPRVAAHVGACLDHEAWDVRRLAADLLGRIGGDTTTDLLRAKLSIEPEPLVKDAVQRALGEVEGTQSVRRTTLPPVPGSWRPR